jgi:hypothetical protein
MRLIRNIVPGVGMMMLLALGAQAAPEDNVVASGVVTWTDGLVIRYQTKTKAQLKDADLEGWTVGEVIGRDRISRYFVNGNKGIYFGYDLVIEQVGQLQPVPSDHVRPFRVKFQPLSLRPEAVRGHYNGPEPAPVRLFSYPQPQPVGDGDAVVFELRLARGRESLRLTESIRFVWHPVKFMPASGRTTE